MLLFVGASVARGTSIAPPAGTQPGDRLLALLAQSSTLLATPAGWTYLGKDTALGFGSLLAVSRDATGGAQDTIAGLPTNTEASISTWRSAGAITAQTGDNADFGTVGAGTVTLPAISGKVVTVGWVTSVTTGAVAVGGGIVEDADVVAVNYRFIWAHGAPNGSIMPSLTVPAAGVAWGQAVASVGVRGGLTFWM